MIRLCVVALLAFAVLADPVQAQGPVMDMMVKGRNALNDLRYKEADSLGKRVLSLGSLLTKQQQVEAMQLVIAANFPEETSDQRQDVAIDYIRQLIQMGGVKTLPRDMSHPGLDSLFVLINRMSQPAKIVLGARIPGSVLYLDDQAQGPITGLRTVLVSPGKATKISVRAEGCAPWDTTITAAASDSLRIGFRNPKCSK